jgi:putative hydrolase of HD superfamily
MIELMLELLNFYNLKDEERAWIELFGISNGESVSGHSWNVAFLTLLFGMEKDVDTLNSLKMSIIHDLAEAETGDIINRAKDSRREITEEEKHHREKEFWNKIGNKEDFEELHELWQESEDRETVEAKIVKDMDLLDLCLQAVKYQKESLRY